MNRLQNSNIDFYNDVFPNGAEKISPSLYRDEDVFLTLTGPYITIYRASLLNEVCSLHSFMPFLFICFESEGILPYFHSRFSITIPSIYDTFTTPHYFGPCYSNYKSRLPQNNFDWVDNSIMVWNTYNPTYISMVRGYTVVTDDITSQYKYNEIGKEIRARLCRQKHSSYGPTTTCTSTKDAPITL